MYYTYYSYETDKGIDGLGYIGYRKLKDADTPQEEDYFGTPKSPKNKDFKENKNKAKIILGEFKTEKEAIAHEIYLHELWSIDTNPHFANQAKQTSTGFCYAAYGENNPMFGKIGENNPSFGITRTYETCNKLAEAQKGKTHKSETRKKQSEALKDKTLRDWIHDNGKKELQITNKDLREKYNLNSGGLSQVISKKSKQHKGWKLL